jgi:xylulokinase
MTGRISLGIDVSTAELRVKALDHDSCGQVAEAVSALPAVTGTDGIREQDVAYGPLAAETIARALAAIAGTYVVAAISITATSGTVVPVDARGEQSGVAVMYDDARGIPFERSLGGTRGRPLSMLGRIMALAAAAVGSASSRSAGQRGFRAASVAQVIGSWLVGHPVAGDTSHFLKAGLDPASTEWPHELVAASGLGVDVLPALVHPGEVLGTVASGPAAGAAVIAGMTDGCTSQLAAGGVGAGDSVGVIGTTLVLKLVSPIDRWDAASGLYSHRAPDGAFWVGGASNVGGGSIVRGSGFDYAEMDRLGRKLGPTAFARYPLARRGERFPVANPDLEAFTVDLAGTNIAEPTDPVAAYRSTLEGVAMVERFGLEAMGADPSANERILSGGATRSPLWNELRAATLRATVRIPTHGESGYGAAVLAVWGAERDAGGGRFTDTVARFTAGGTTLDPDPALVTAMAERYDVFCAALRASSTS